jgi:predicted  nucleic acid-binding Zn-ribbon protein
MVEVKLFVTRDRYDDNYGDYHSVITEGISDWEIVTEEEYELLKNTLWIIQRDKNIDGQLIAVRKDRKKVHERIDSIKAELKRIKDEEESKKKAAEIKKAKRLAAKKNKDLDTLQKLKEKYPDDI